MVSNEKFKRSFAQFATTSDLTKDYFTLAEEVMEPYKFDGLYHGMVLRFLGHSFVFAQESFFRGEFDLMNSLLDNAHNMLVSRGTPKN